MVSEGASYSSGSITASAYGFGVNVRYYFNEALTSDTYVSATHMSGSVEAENSLVKVTADASSTFVAFGKTWMWEHFNLDAFVGIRSISVGPFEVNSFIDTTSEEIDETGLTLGFTLGFAF